MEFSVGSPARARQPRGSHGATAVPARKGQEYDETLEPQTSSTRADTTEAARGLRSRSSRSSRSTLSPTRRRRTGGQGLEVWSSLANDWMRVQRVTEMPDERLLVEYEVDGYELCRKRVWPNSALLRAASPCRSRRPCIPAESIAATGRNEVLEEEEDEDEEDEEDDEDEDGQGMVPVRRAENVVVADKIKVEEGKDHDEDEEVEDRDLAATMVKCSPGATPCIPAAADKDSFVGIRVGGHYVVGKKIGAGSFGTVHVGTNRRTFEKVAIKFEMLDCPYLQLLDEAKRYKVLSGGVGIPRVYWSGPGDGFNAMVMDYLGPSLEELFDDCQRQFSLNTVAMLGEQMVRCVEYVHNKGYLHRDIKPNNFTIGRGDNRQQVHMIDFGLAKKYLDEGSRHIQDRDGLPFVGTARYSSINAHLGKEQSRRDDLVSLGYVLTYFLHGHLPWQSLKAQASSKYEWRKMVLEMKQQTPSKRLCSELAPYFKHCERLQFKEDPNYRHLRHILGSLRQGDGHSSHCAQPQFDWELPANA